MRPSATTGDPTSASGTPKRTEPRESHLKTLWQRCALAMMVSATRPIQKMSPAASRRFGSALGRLASRIALKQRRRALANLSLAYNGTMTEGERSALMVGVFEHFGRGLVDFLRAPTVTREELEANIVCDGSEYIKDGLAAGRGIIFVTGHIGNWEALGRYGTQVLGLPLTVIAKDPRDPALAAFLRRQREGFGFSVLSRGESAREALKTLRRNEIICLLADQNSGDTFAPFFGVPAGTAVGPAALALHTGAALLPIYCLNQEDGRFHIRCFPPISTARTGDRAADEHRVMAEFNLSLESIIREYPNQWLWIHNRWKSSFETANHERAWGPVSEDQKDAYQQAADHWRS